MTEIESVRASSVPRAWYCSESVRKVPPLIDPVNASGELGSAAHLLYRTIDDPSTAERIPEVAETFDVDPKALAIRWHQARKVWDRVGEFLTDEDPANVSVERKYEAELFVRGDFVDLKLSGTMDRVRFDPESRDPDLVVDTGRVYILDWKTGRYEGDYSRQLLAYAYLAYSALAADGADVTDVWAGAAFVASESEPIVHAKIYNRETLDNFADQLYDRVRNGEGTFAPGDHCTFCPRKVSCEGFHKYRDDAISALTVGNEARWDGDPRETGPVIAKGLRNLSVITREGEVMKDLAKEYAAQHGGRFPAGEGRIVEAQERTRTNIKTEAFAKVHERIGAERMAEAVTIKVGAVKNAVADDAPRGEKKDAIESFLSELRDANMLDETQSVVLQEVNAED